MEEPSLIHIEKANKSLFENIELFHTAEKERDYKDQFIFAMAVGFRYDEKEPIKTKKWFFRSSYLKKEDKNLINALALAHFNDPEKLLNIKEVFEIAEEYANGGIIYLNKQIEKMPFGSFNKKLEKILQKDILEIKEKKEKIETSKKSKENLELMKIIAKGESDVLEFKSSLRWDLKEKQINPILEEEVALTIAGFLNNKGGILLIGVKDSGEIFGIEKDMKLDPRKNRDGFEQRFIQVFDKYIGIEHFDYIEIDYITYQEKTVCSVAVKPSIEPIYFNGKKEKEFHLRIGNTTRKLDIQQAHKYSAKHWP